MSEILRQLRSFTDGCVAFWNVPMWTMLGHTTIYGAMVYFAKPPILRTTLLLYLPYCLFDNSHRNGRSWGVRWLSPATLEAIRGNWMFRQMGRYLPVSLHKTVELPPSKPYIMCCHPHGIIAVGFQTALGTNGCGFTEVFPDIRRFGVTLNIVFSVPIFRDWILLNGYISADRDSMARQLAEGNSVVLVPGGALEALYAIADGPMTLIARRRGFIKLAIDSNAELVPCLGFGENQLFTSFDTTKDPNSLISWVQKKGMKFLGFSLPVLTTPWLNQRPVDVVVGAPVPLPGSGVKDPVEDLHRRYWKAVKDLYDEQKEKFGHEHVPLKLLMD